MGKVRLVRPTVPAVRYIAQHLRDADVQELRAVHGDDLDPVDCLQVAVDSSEEVWIAITDAGEPFAVFGVAPLSLLGGEGCPWMLGTDVMLRHGRDIVMLSRQHVARWGQRYDCLFNYVDSRNLRSIAWLRHTGFVIGPAQPYGLEGRPFHRFERCTSVRG